jgi:hypothetical protein
MGTKAETIGVSARPAGFMLWTAAVAALAAAALIMSAVALIVATRDRAVIGFTGAGIHEAASIGAPLWDAGKLEAMQAGSRPWKAVFWPGSSRFGPLARAGR